MTDNGIGEGNGFTVFALVPHEISEVLRTDKIRAEPAFIRALAQVGIALHRRVVVKLVIHRQQRMQGKFRVLRCGEVYCSMRMVRFVSGQDPYRVITVTYSRQKI